MIPNVIHFAYTSPPGQGLPFSFVHYLAVAGAARYAGPDGIVLHAVHRPEGRWWDAAARLAEVRRATVPEAAFNCTFEHPAHQADAIRLDTLHREGGIFLDLDVISLRSYTPLLDGTADTVLGWEDTLAVCPAVAIAAPGARFIERWITGYDPERSEWQGFRSHGRDEYWGEISTRYPRHLAQQYPAEVSLAPPSHFYPVHWRRASCERLFYPPEEGGLGKEELDASYSVHLWETGNWTGRLRDLTPESVRRGGTVLDELFEPLLEGV